MKITSQPQQSPLSEQIRVRNAKPLIHLQGVSKDYFGSTALKPLNFDIYAGEVHALFGENGAGKSTLLKIITGDTQPSSGGILITNGSRLVLCITLKSLVLVPYFKNIL